MRTITVRKYPFLSVSQAISYLNTKNPARARSVNLLEPEFGSKPSANHFTGDHPDDIYASVVYAVKKTLSLFPDKQTHRIFALYWIGPRSRCLAKEEIAKCEGLSLSRVRKILRQISNELEAELVRRQLMPNPLESDH